MTIHSTAIVDSKARIHETAEIGPYCVIGPNVEIGAGTRLVSHVIVDNHTRLGSNNVIYSFASVGAVPQDLKYGGEAARLVIGDNNVIREGATLNIGTETGRMESTVGNGCLLMAYSHVAHDCVLGDNVVLANSVGLAGHVHLDDNVTVGGLAGIHQFCRVGRHAFIAGGAMVAQDVVPFTIAQGDRAQHVGINVVGLKRKGWSKDQILIVRRAFKDLFHSETTRMVALEKTENTIGRESNDVAEICRFIRDAQRGVCAAKTAGPSTDPYEG